ncbi:MAG: ParB N-terminal domain-containing protein [Candidatus Azobacteroides sp.]|nr:ParB N-terminal domain-containing protein [Candidatus Azobacteroides sp.]
MKYLEINKLQPHKDNPRKISFGQIEKLCESIKNNPEYFEARPIICDSNYTIYAGNSRYKAAKKLGLEKVPVHVMDLPEEKMREIMIRDNVNNGAWNEAILADDWNMDSLVNFGLEFNSFSSNKNEETSESEVMESKTKKKNKARKIITCPYCNKDIEI